MTIKTYYNLFSAASFIAEWQIQWIRQALYAGVPTCLISHVDNNPVAMLLLPTVDSVTRTILMISGEYMYRAHHRRFDWKENITNRLRHRLKYMNSDILVKIHDSINSILFLFVRDSNILYHPKKLRLKKLKHKLTYKQANRQR